MSFTASGAEVPPHGKSSTYQNFFVFGQSVAERITCTDHTDPYYVFDQSHPPGTGVPPHMHAAEDELVFVRAGQFEVFLNGTVIPVGPGAILNFVRGSLHGFRSLGPDLGQTTWIVTPGLTGQMFLRELGAFPPGPPDPDRLDALHARYRITMPPPTDRWW